MSNDQFFSTYDETKDWLDHMEITKYHIDPTTLEVDTNDNVHIQHKNLKVLPVKFRYIKGAFNCAYNKLTSLKGFPVKTNNSVRCYFNNITSLEGAPKYIGGDFRCNNNQLTSLKGAPQYVIGDFICNDNLLTTLQCPDTYIRSSFNCYSNNLIVLSGAPKYVGHNFICAKNMLQSLKGAPIYIGGGVRCDDNKLKTLEGCPQNITGGLVCDWDDDTLCDINKYIKSVAFIRLNATSSHRFSIMWVFFIKSLTHLEIHNASEEQKQVCSIINAHLKDKRSGPSCQIELIDAGLSKYIKI